jgi:hypothetical protein
MDRGGEFRHGFDEVIWEKAKAETKAILNSRAKQGSPITYSDLCDLMSVIRLEPHDSRLAHFLGQISTEEYEEGRALLTALVVHKHDLAPGDGFYKLAESLGYKVKDREEFWLTQIELLRKQ